MKSIIQNYRIIYEFYEIYHFITRKNLLFLFKNRFHKVAQSSHFSGSFRGKPSLAIRNRRVHVAATVQAQSFCTVQSSSRCNSFTIKRLVKPAGVLGRLFTVLTSVEEGPESRKRAPAFDRDAGQAVYSRNFSPFFASARAQSRQQKQQRCCQISKAVCAAVALYNWSRLSNYAYYISIFKNRI